jgi:hypothetical protein
MSMDLLVRNYIFASAAALALLQTPARAQDNSTQVICNVIIDRAAELVRTGETARARAMKPQLQQCLQLLKAEQMRAARDLVKRYDEAVRQ